MKSLIELDLDPPCAFADGVSFGDVGRYEILRGRARFAVDPDEAAQQTVTDLKLAPRDENGRVLFSATFEILRPVDPARANGRLFFEFVNRGNRRALQFYNDAPASNRPTTAEHAGNGFLMRRGYTVVWIGWQGDVLPGDNRMLLEVPVARLADGPLVGRNRVEFFTAEERVHSFPLSTSTSTRSNPTASRDTKTARLTRRRYALSDRHEIPSDQWSFARIERGNGVDNQGPESVVLPSDSHIHYPAGFESGWLYELIYQACDPLVLGLGHVAVRNFISFLRYEDRDAAGTPNPLRSAGRMIEHAYAWGRSQAGRCVRDYVYLGYNADEAGRRVFDGMMPHVAGAGRAAVNHRFGNMVLLPGQEFENHFTAVDRFPFSYAVSTDHLTGRTDGILKRPDTDPKLFHTDTAAEYWHRRASLVHTDSAGNDLDQPDNVRVYIWASTQHFISPRPLKPARGIAQTYLNIASSSMLFRAMLDNMDDWVSGRAVPPPSRLPRKSDGTLVSYETWREQFPRIAGLALPRGPSRLELADFGDRLDEGILAKDPPDVVPNKEYAVQVSAVDSDGNETGGVRVPMIQAPLGTYTGWALRAELFGNGVMLGVTGSYIPLPNDDDERAQTRDPRPSILARYGTAEGYLGEIAAAGQKLIAERMMLEEDLPRCIEAARDWGRPRHAVRL